MELMEMAGVVLVLVLMFLPTLKVARTKHATLVGMCFWVQGVIVGCFIGWRFTVWLFSFSG